MKSKIERTARTLAELLAQSKNDYLCALEGYVDADLAQQIASREHKDANVATHVALSFRVELPLPALDRLLLKLADRARDTSVRIVDSHLLASHLPQPNNPRARVHHFVRYLSRQISMLGRPLHSHVATLANVLLGANEDAESVRLLLLEDKRAKRPRAAHRKGAKA